MSLGLAVATDIANATLTFYVRGKALAQTMQDKPLLAWLRSGGQSFPGGKDYISEPVKGVFMSDTAGFLAGYSEDDALTFRQAANLLRCQYPWKEIHAGLIITWTELKKDGVTITDNGQPTEHSKTELFRLASLLQDRLDDFAESYGRSMNTMFWKDGTQDAKAIPGITSILTATPSAGTTGGISRATYTWWRHRQTLNIASDPTDQTLTKKLRSEARQLRRYGGKPNKVLAGSLAIEALEAELTEKGIYSQSGFMNNGKNELGVADIQMRGIGTFEYDPTMDDLGMSKYIYVLDGRRLKWRPMEKEEDKMLTPERPYNYMVFLKSITNTGGIVGTQLNCHGVYSVA